MCSVTSATDHFSGAALKFHCAGDNPLVASATPSLVDSKYFIAFSRSAADNDCACAATTIHASVTTKINACFTEFRIPDFSCSTRILGPGILFYVFGALFKRSLVETKDVCVSQMIQRFDA